MERDDTPGSRTAGSPRLDRRHFNRLAARTGLGLAAWTSLGVPLAGAHGDAHTHLPAADQKRLDESPFVYISPLRSDGGESTCHAELWYGWLDDHVVVIVSASGWKARAVERGLDSARIWVGGYGRWKTWYGGTNEAFRESQPFRAKAVRSESPKLLNRLLDLYETKYPEEIADWRVPMRQGFGDGSRVLLRYALTPNKTA